MYTMYVKLRVVIYSYCYKGKQNKYTYKLYRWCKQETLANVRQERIKMACDPSFLGD